MTRMLSAIVLMAFVISATACRKQERAETFVDGLKKKARIEVLV